MKKIIVLSLALALVLTGCGQKEKPIVLAPEEARAKAEKFINDELISGGADQAKAVIKEITEDRGLYKLLVVVESQGRTQEVESYMTLDGEKFFTQAIDIEIKTADAPQAEGGQQPSSGEAVNKQDKPKIELFVMSHCPFGTQIEKGIIPVLEIFGDKINFELKFCDYAMHGKKEIDEQLNQYCIQKEEPTKLLDYLKCFLETGVSTGCLAKAKVDNTKLKYCTQKADEEFEVTDNLNDESRWFNGNYPQFNVNKEDVDKYDISGSPALVLNGEKIASARDPQSLMKTICFGFTNVPDECGETLSSSTPSPGFGFGESGNDSGGVCD